MSKAWGAGGVAERARAADAAAKAAAANGGGAAGAMEERMTYLLTNMVGETVEVTVRARAHPRERASEGRASEGARAGPVPVRHFRPPKNPRKLDQNSRARGGGGEGRGRRELCGRPPRSRARRPTRSELML